jgi:hypothetical protein
VTTDHRAQSRRVRLGIILYFEHTGSEVVAGRMLAIGITKLASGTRACANDAGDNL